MNEPAAFIVSGASSKEARTFVTVLMTVFNGGEYLTPAIQSVLAQDFRDFELLIVDDCSTDDSIRTIENFFDQRIRLVRNPQNIGQTAALNVGLREAHGEYVARIDADDIALPGWLTAQVAWARQYPEAVVVSLPVVLIDTVGRVKKLQGTFSRKEDIYLRILTHSPINHGGCLMKREGVLREGGYDNNPKIAADFGLWSKLVRRGYSLTAADHVGMAVRVHGGSISLKSKECLQSELKQIISENMIALTDYRPTESEMDSLWGMFYDLDHFPVEQIQKTKALFENIIIRRKASLGITDGACRRYVQTICRETDLRVRFRFFDRLLIGKGIPTVGRWLLRWQAICKLNKSRID